MSHSKNPRMPDFAPGRNLPGLMAGSNWSEPRFYGSFEGMDPEKQSMAAKWFKDEAERFDTAMMVSDFLHAPLETFQDMLRTEDGRTGWNAVNEAIQQYLDRMEDSSDGGLEDCTKARNLTCCLAMAALAPGMHSEPMKWDNRDQLSIVLDRMLNIRAKGADDPSLRLLYLMICYALEYYEDVVPAANGLDLNIEDEVSQLTRLVLQRARRQLDFPIFSADYAARVRMAWDYFVQHTAALREDCAKSLSLEEVLNTFDEACHTFCNSLQLMVWTKEKQLLESIQSPGMAAPLFLTSSGFVLDLFPLEYAASQMPDTLKGSWDPQVGEPSSWQDREGLAELLSDPEFCRVSVSDTPQHDGAAICLWSKELYDAYQKDEGFAYQFVYNWLAELMGEMTCAACIGGFVIAKESTNAPSATLSELPRLLEDLGYPRHATLQDCLAKQHRSYQRAAAGGKRLRDDIISGWTDFTQLQDAYEQGDNHVCEHYLDFGITAAFVAWPASLKGSPGGDILSLLKNHLAASAGEAEYRIIGEATGTKYRYLDLLIWSSSAVLSALEAFFRSIPNGSLARIQLFRPDSRPFPIDCAKLAESTLPPKTGFVPSTKQSGASGSQKKGKKGKGKHR